MKKKKKLEYFSTVISPALLLCSVRGMASPPWAESADQEPINRPFLAMPLQQKPPEWPGSVGLTPLHMGRMLAGFY